VSNDRRVYFTLDDRVRLRDEKDPESNNKMVQVLTSHSHILDYGDAAVQRYFNTTSKYAKEA